VQEATGAPVGPSALTRPKSRKAAARPKGTPGNSPETPPNRQPEKPPDPNQEATRPGHRPLEFWHKSIEFEGQKVYQRDDLIDPRRVDDQGRTNLRRMKMGRAPIGEDGESISLHHLVQQEKGSLAEVSESFHRDNRNVLHLNPSDIESGISRSDFNNFRRRYWRRRAKDFGDYQ
jgi:filamentous hemagglutinin